MPSRLKNQINTKQAKAMIGELKPYQIRYKSLKPNFKIDAKTFTLLPQLDVLNRENENPDPNRLLIDRKTFNARIVLN